MLKFIALLLSLLLGLFSFSAEEPSVPGNEQQLLADYYEATVATVGGDHYSEMVLYRNANGSYEIDLFTKFEDEPEICSVYPADETYYDAIVSVVKENGIDKWNDTKYVAGLTGKEYAFRFYLDGEYYRVTSDNMPDDGLTALAAIRNVLGKAFTD